VSRSWRKPLAWRGNESKFDDMRADRESPAKLLGTVGRAKAAIVVAKDEDYRRHESGHRCL
jgi:hypothetical protein